MDNQQKKLPINGSNRFEISDAKLIGQSDPAQMVKVSIYARRNPNPSAEVVSKIEKLSTELPGKRTYLSDDEFNNVYGADPGDLNKIESWAKQNNLSVLEKDVSQKRVTVEGTIKDISAAFDINLNEYELPGSGQYRGRAGQVYVPEELYGIIEGVFGLDTRPIGHSRRKQRNFSPAPLANISTANLTTPWVGTFFPTQVAGL